MEERMKNFGTALTKLIEGFEGFTEELRNMADMAPQDAGAGEEPDDWQDRREDNDAEVEKVPAREDIDDDKIITMRSGDLRKVLDAYRKLVRYARNGKIPTQDERLKLHQAVLKVKHLVRKPVR
jgi:hypothetical protein